MDFWVVSIICVVVTNAAMNMDKQYLFEDPVSVLSKSMSRTQVHMASLSLEFLRHSIVFSTEVAPFYIPSNSPHKASSFSTSSPTLFSSFSGSCQLS